MCDARQRLPANALAARAGGAGQETDQIDDLFVPVDLVQHIGKAAVAVADNQHIG